MGRTFPVPRPSVFLRGPGDVRERPRPGGREPPPLPTRKRPLGSPPPTPRERDLNRFGTGARFRSHRLTWLQGDHGAPLNDWVDMVSTWVLRSRYDSDLYLFGDEGTGDWTVEFLDGATVVYHDTPASVWSEFFSSSSKGMFIYYRCKEEGRPYDLLREGSRKVTAKQKRIRDVLRNEGSRAYGHLGGRA